MVPANRRADRVDRPLTLSTMAPVGRGQAESRAARAGSVPARRAPEDDDLLAAIRAVMRASLQAADEIGGVSVTQLRALTVLHRAGRTNLAQLAAGMGVTVSTTSRLVDRLVAAGLVDRRTAPHNGREIALRLTRRGRATLDRYDDLRLGWLRGRIDTLPPPDRDVAVRVVKVLGGRVEPAPAVAEPAG